MSTKKTPEKKAAMQAKKEKQLKKIPLLPAPVPVLPNLLKMLKPK